VKLKNTTDYEDRFLRRMVAWCCRQLEMPVKYVRGARFGNARHFWGGLAYLDCRRIGVRVGSPKNCDQPLKHYKFRDGFQVVTNNRLEVLLLTTAHELAHLDAYRRKNMTRGNGRGHGGSERYIEGRAAQVLEAFRAMRAELLSSWLVAPSTPAERPVLSVQQVRATKAISMLDKWQRKAKLAATKVRQYKKQVRYYEKALAAKRSV
jgi:hypothetical protein